MRFNTISFLSDYGRADEFVGIVHSVVRSLAPEVRVIDLTHDIGPHDVRAGGLALARSVNHMAPGVVLGVVDPGVGTDRKPVAIEVADGQAFLVGPDNGLLAPAVAMVGGATDAVVLDNVEYHLGGDATTFDGRDVFAPVAAHLCNGVALHDLGTPINPALLTPGLLPISEVGPEGQMHAEVLWIDRFGNVQLNVDPDDLASWPDAITVEGGRLKRTAQRVSAFSDIPTGGVGYLVDAYGLVTLAVNRSSLAMELQLSEGDDVTLWPAEVDPRAGSVVSAVSLSSKPGPGSHPAAGPGSSTTPSTERPEDPSCGHP